MRRLVLVLSLMLFATAATAGNSGSSDDAATCPKSSKSTQSTATTANDTDVSGGGQGSTGVPVRSSSRGGVSQRWHSLLPGMFR